MEIPNKTTPQGKGARTALQNYAALGALALLGVASSALLDLTWQPAWVAPFIPAAGGLISFAQNKLGK